MKYPDLQRNLTCNLIDGVLYDITSVQMRTTIDVPNVNINEDVDISIPDVSQLLFQQMRF